MKAKRSESITNVQTWIYSVVAFGRKCTGTLKKKTHERKPAHL